MATTNVYDVAPGLTASTTYRRITTSTLGIVTCLGTSNDITVSVQSVVGGGTIASSQTICSGGDPAAFTESVAASGSGILTYQWKYSTDNYAATLATTSTYDVSSGLTATTTYRRITTSTLGGITCTVNTQMGKVNMTSEKIMCQDIVPGIFKAERVFSQIQDNQITMSSTEDLMGMTRAYSILRFGGNSDWN